MVGNVLYSLHALPIQNLFCKSPSPTHKVNSLFRSAEHLPLHSLFYQTKSGLHCCKLGFGQCWVGIWKSKEHSVTVRSPCVVKDGPSEPAPASTFTIHWMPVMTQLWMILNPVTTQFHPGNPSCKK